MGSATVVERAWLVTRLSRGKPADRCSAMTNLELGDRLRSMDGGVGDSVASRWLMGDAQSRAHRGRTVPEASCYYAVGTRYCVSTAEGHLAAGWLRRIPKPGMLVERLHAAKPACNDVGGWL